MLDEARLLQVRCQGIRSQLLGTVGKVVEVTPHLEQLSFRIDSSSNYKPFLSVYSGDRPPAEVAQLAF